MTAMNIIAILITVSAAFAYINYRFLKLPMTIGLMISSLVFSLLILITHWLGFDLKADAVVILQSIDFNATLMKGMLSFLLFAGSMHINLHELKQQKIPVTVLATVGVLSSTILIGFAMYGIVLALGYSLPFIYCLLFGALISPTDPIAVLGILKTANAPKTLEIKIAGESLFNDGVGVVIFIAILGYATDLVDMEVGQFLLKISKHRRFHVLTTKPDFLPSRRNESRQHGLRTTVNKHYIRRKIPKNISGLADLT